MPMPGLFTVDSAEVRAQAAALQRAGTDMSVKIIDATSGTMSTVWGEELAARGGVSLVQRDMIASGADSYATGYGVTMRAAVSGTPLSGGAIPARDGRAFEFGKSVARVKTFTQRSRKGNRYSVTRSTTNQLPSRSRSGWLAYPAASKAFPRFLEMWLQIIVKVSHDAVEAKK